MTFRPAILAGFTAAFCFCSGNAFATTIYQTGFEPPTYQTGLLSGQDNWSGSGSGATTLVETTVAHSGTQAVSVTPVSNTNTGSQHADPYSLSGNSVLGVSDYAYFSSAGTPTYWTADGTFYQGGGYAVLNVDQSGQIVFSSDAGNENTGAFVSTDSWTELGFSLNYATDTATVFENGVAVGGPYAFNGAADQNLLNFQFYAQPNGAASPQMAYFDDVSLTASTTSTTPEPASLVSVLTGLAALGLRKRVRR